MKQLNLQLVRHTFNETEIIGTLYHVDSSGILHPFCDTLEPNKSKLRPKGCIPLGSYSVKLAKSPKYTPITGLLYPRISDVDGFTGILMHAGNTYKDTLGCILVGECYNPKSGWLSKSSSTMVRLRSLMQTYSTITLTIKPLL